jgi:aminoglycoside 6'-N-acetyltransferase I
MSGLQRTQPSYECDELTRDFRANAESAVELAHASIDRARRQAEARVAYIQASIECGECRRQGIARAVVDSVVEWALASGCVELASDSLLENCMAHAAHRALGFEDTERVVYCLRTLSDVLSFKQR